MIYQKQNLSLLLFKNKLFIITRSNITKNNKVNRYGDTSLFCQDFRQMFAQRFCFWRHLLIVFFTLEKRKKKEKNVTLGGCISVI